MVSLRFVIVFMTLFAVSGFAEAKLYKWIDENGVTHFSNTAPPQDEDDVQSQGEVKSSSSTNNHSPGIDHVINSYKQDELHDRGDAIESRFRERMKSSNQSQIELYKKWIERDKVTLKERQDDLRRVERESYSDSNSHRIKVERYKNFVRKAEIELKADQQRLEIAEQK